ncbi:hypothetical protein [Brevundimonas sp. SL130]|uniref:hypothetical protein n=1 Tax=Brevundimonas sp. SL130 TaxID=2995143 RepID=UPI00226CB66E|nr:hypothetical protein [Brevundimonas sp. SL130]WAC60786.1 hypothetical protein OU998_04890 [Brevundimonas sp. SL130]
MTDFLTGDEFTATNHRASAESGCHRGNEGNGRPALREPLPCSTKFIDLGGVSNAQAAEWLVDLSEGLSEADQSEIKATSGLEPAVALVSHVMISDMAWAILDDAEPIAVFGCVPIGNPSVAHVWIFGADRMDERDDVLEILRQSRSFLNLMQTRHQTLYSFADARNTRRLTWLRRCGFQAYEPRPPCSLEGHLSFRFTTTQRDV